ncbi:MAG: eCIS core domain-containing protein, partial [Bradyrhizobium sp.]
IQVMVAPVTAEINIEQKVEDAIKKASGPDVAKAIEIIRLPQKFEKRAAVEVGPELQHLIDTGKLGDLQGMVLAAALRQAKDLNDGRKKPLPPAVRVFMAGTFDAALLDKARYVVDNNFGSISGIINSISEIFSDNHAVTVDDTVVFAKNPADDDVWFWGHELQHVVQYTNLGIEGFAAKYLAHSSDMENEANAMGDKALLNAEAIRGYLLSKASPQAAVR